MFTLVGRYAADSYGMGTGQPVSMSGHAYPVPESSFPAPQDPYPDVSAGNEAQILQESYMGHADDGIHTSAHHLNVRGGGLIRLSVTVFFIICKDMNLGHKL